MKYIILLFLSNKFLNDYTFLEYLGCFYEPTAGIYTNLAAMTPNTGQGTLYDCINFCKGYTYAATHYVK
jgi:hypothetical protein